MSNAPFARLAIAHASGQEVEEFLRNPKRPFGRMLVQLAQLAVRPVVRQHLIQAAELLRTQARPLPASCNDPFRRRRRNRSSPSSPGSPPDGERPDPHRPGQLPRTAHAAKSAKNKNITMRFTQRVFFRTCSSRGRPRRTRFRSWPTRSGSSADRAASKRISGRRKRSKR